MLEWITQINNASGLSLPTLSRMIGQLGQGFGAGDSDAYGDTGFQQDFCTHGTAQVLQ